jgi:hypothetical protein
VTVVGSALYGLRWMLSSQHPAAYMASSAVSGGINQLNYGMSSGLSQAGIPGMDMGSLLQGGVGGFAQYQNTLRQYQAAFSGTIGAMSEDFKKSFNSITKEQLSAMGYSKQNLVEYMDVIGRATGRTSSNMAELTKNTLSFARAYSVSDRALASTAQTFGRLGAVSDPGQLGSRLINSGINPSLLNEILPQLSNLVAGQMDRGGTGRTAMASAGLVASVNRMGLSLGDRGGAYLGAGGVRLAGQLDTGFSEGTAMSMLSNPMRAGESWAEYRSRLENPTTEMLNNAVTRARAMGPEAGAVMLVKGFGVSYTDALNMIGGGSRGAGLRVTGLSGASSAESISARAGMMTTDPMRIGAMATSILSGEDGLGRSLYERTANIAQKNNFAVYRELFTGSSVLQTLMGPVLAGLIEGDSGRPTTASMDQVNMDKVFRDFNTKHGSKIIPGSFDLNNGGSARLYNTGSLRTAKDSADLKALMHDAGFDMSGDKITPRMGGLVKTAADTVNALDSISAAIARLGKSASGKIDTLDFSKSVPNGRKK